MRSIKCRAWHWLMSQLGCIAIVGIVGCSDGGLRTYPVRGVVVFEDGSPVKMGTIECQSTEKKINSKGEIGLDGSFVLSTYREGDGAIAGDHKCVIVQFVMSENIPNHKPSTKGVVHKRYASYSTTDLYVNVKAVSENQVRLVVAKMDHGKESTTSQDEAHDSHSHD